MTGAAGTARTIDLPLEQLPRVDEHGTLVLAPREVTWSSLLAIMDRGFTGPVTTRVARALGCSETEAHGEPGRIGSTIPGFVIARVVEPAVLALEGQHRFSRYGLVISLETTRDGHTLLRAETRADFPGARGSAYRALVIGTRGHVLVVKRLLGAVKRHAERRA